MNCEACNKSLDAAGFCPDCDYIYDHHTDRMEPPKDGKISKERMQKRAVATTRTTGDFVMNLGKYQGQRLGEIPVDYLDWILGQDWLWGATRDAIKSHLENERKSEWEELERD